jgi:citrate/tricarballylate utilization protein
MPALDLYQEANRQFTICNACRYCEGFCPVFQAIETRRDFEKGDVFYLAHLCHDCQACYHACMYTPPHEFAIDIPQIMSQVRANSYRRWSWPGLLARSFTDSRIGAVSGGLAIILIVAVTLAAVPMDRMFSAHLGAGAFYRVVPYPAMVIPAVILAVYGWAVWMYGGGQFWSEVHGAKAIRFRQMVEALGAALSLRYLKGGGPGCPYPDERPSSARRICHNLTSWGFGSALVSTTLAFVYQDFFHWLPPYPVTSAPVVFGTIGGVALIAGTIGLMRLKEKSDPAQAGTGMRAMDYLFLIFLGSTALTGMLVLIFRTTSAMGILLTLHLAVVAALFVTAPYGKFVHLVYRSLAIVLYQIEKAGPKKDSAH